MRRSRALLCLLLALCPLAGTVPVAAADRGADGVYRGFCLSARGRAGLTLTVSGDGAELAFCALPGQAAVPDGSYRLRVRAQGGDYVLTPTEWITQPDGYASAELTLSLTGDTLSGSIGAVEDENLVYLTRSAAGAWLSPTRRTSTITC